MALNFKKTILSSERWVAPSGRRDYIKLDLNENYGLFDKKFLNKFKNFDAFTLSSYPEYENLLKALSKYTKQPAHNIALTNGADQGIELVLRLFFSKNDKVVMPSPIFSIYDHVLNILNVKVSHILYEDREQYFEFPFEKTFAELKKSNGLILCNPNNPLGSPIEKDQLLLLIKESNRLNIPCIIDEAYFEFYGKTSANIIKKYKNIIIIRTFSKAFGLAGLRLGYILADNTVIEQILKLRGPWDVNHFAVFAGETVLGDKKYFSSKMKSFLRLKASLKEFLEKNNMQVYDSRANFLIVKPKNGKKLIEQLKSVNILITGIDNYPFSSNLLKNAVRITIPSSQKDLKILKTNIKKIYG
ncbi:MAG: histidinol-phosphate aminotransferase family protein [bacterium]|nr:histidinol-phosphate aminotransferase family protein [bacterium]